jgi:hypothetical protein
MATRVLIALAVVLVMVALWGLVGVAVFMGDGSAWYALVAFVVLVGFMILRYLVPVAAGYVLISWFVTGRVVGFG